MRKYILLLVVVSCLLCGCTVEANRVYTVCKASPTDVYCYDSDGNFYYVVNNKPLLVGSAGLQARPALKLSNRSGDFVFEPVLPGLYRGTLTSVSHYVSKLVSELNGEVEIVYADWNNLEIFVYSSEVNTRILFNIKGDVRIYAVDNFQNPILPLYINEGNIFVR